MNQALRRGLPRLPGAVPAAAGERQLRAGVRGRQARPTTRATAARSPSSTSTSGARSSPPTTRRSPSPSTSTGSTATSGYYPDPLPYAPVTGYDTPYSATGIERAENKLLAGTDPRLTVRNLIDLITGKPKKGATVQLTVNSVAQQAAYSALKATGLPAARSPSTRLPAPSSHWPPIRPSTPTSRDVRRERAEAGGREVPQLPQQPLLNRAINETFPPGSTFKVVTSSTAFSTGKYTPADPVQRADRPQAAGHHEPAHQLRQPAVRQRREGAAHLRVHRVLQHGVRRPRHAPRRQGAAAPGEQVRDEPQPADPAGGLAEQLPAGVRPRLHRVLGDRPVQRHGDTAPGGDVLRRDRQRRHAHAALHGAAGDRPEPHLAGDRPAKRAEPDGKPDRWPAR